MRPRSEAEEIRLEALIAEFRRLVEKSDEALAGIPIRGRPNWGLFFEAQREMSKVVELMSEITG